MPYNYDYDIDAVSLGRVGGGGGGEVGGITTSYTDNIMIVATPFELQIQPTWIIWKWVINDSWFVSLIGLKTHFIIF